MIQYLEFLKSCISLGKSYCLNGAEDYGWEVVRGKIERGWGWGVEKIEELVQSVD